MNIWAWLYILFVSTATPLGWLLWLAERRRRIMRKDFKKK